MGDRRRRGESRRDWIVRVNRERAARRDTAPDNDMLIGGAFVAMGFIIGPPIAGIITGVPLIALGLWGKKRSGYAEKTTARTEWVRRVKEDMASIDRGELPRYSCRDPGVRAMMRQKGYSEPRPRRGEGYAASAGYRSDEERR